MSNGPRLAVGILIFDDVEVLDFAGPFEVFSRTRTVAGADSRRTDDSAPFETFTVARSRDTITAIGGLTVDAALFLGRCAADRHSRRAGRFRHSRAAARRADAGLDPRDRRPLASGDVGLHRRAPAREDRAAPGETGDDALGGTRAAGVDRPDAFRCSAIAASFTTGSSPRPACPPASTCHSRSSNRSAAGRWRRRRLTTSNIHGEPTMCRNIKTLFNFDPPATDEEIRAASLQFVRKLSGFTCTVESERGGVRSRDRRDRRGRAPVDRLVVDQRRAAQSRGSGRRGEAAIGGAVRRESAERHCRLPLPLDECRTTSGQNSSQRLPPMRVTMPMPLRTAVCVAVVWLGGSHAFSIKLLRVFPAYRPHAGRRRPSRPGASTDVFSA